MDHVKVAKEQILHLLFGFVIVMAIGTFAVGLDILASVLPNIGVSAFTSNAIAFTAHALLATDLVLFFIYIVLASIDIVRGMLK